MRGVATMWGDANPLIVVDGNIWEIEANLVNHFDFENESGTLIVPRIGCKSAVGILIQILLETLLGIGLLSAAEESLGCRVGQRVTLAYGNGGTGRSIR